LFVPAHRRDWVAKAIRVSPRQPGAVVLDIEDSVPPQFKPQAMGYLKSEIQELRDAGVGAFVRIQPLYEGTAAEIEAAVTEGLTAIVPPKVSSAEEIRRLHDLLSYAEGCAGVAHGSVGLLPLPETAQGCTTPGDWRRRARACVASPTAEVVACFKGLLEAFDAAENAGLGAVSYQGAMVDYAMPPLAKEVLAEAARNR
jgi:citrate lyase subunit beta/citryl-CoA lyase